MFSPHSHDILGVVPFRDIAGDFSEGMQQFERVCLIEVMTVPSPCRICHVRECWAWWPWSSLCKITVSKHFNVYQPVKRPSVTLKSVWYGAMSVHTCFTDYKCAGTNSGSWSITGAVNKRSVYVELHSWKISGTRLVGLLSAKARPV